MAPPARLDLAPEADPLAAPAHLDGKGTTGFCRITDLAAACRSHRGFLDKRGIGMVADVLGPSDGRCGPGDDTAAIALPGPADGFVLAGGEALSPPFVRADPFAAGVAGVIATVNDVAASGGRTLGVVDTIVASPPVAERLLSGLKRGSALYGTSIVGGHLTLCDDVDPSLSVFGFGHAEQLLSTGNVRSGQSLLLACCLEGAMRQDFSFFSSVTQRAGKLAQDVELLARAAEEECCLAAKDVSMAGLLGSLVLLLELTGLGAIIDLEQVPCPSGVPLERWLVSFPQFAFLLSTPPSRVASCRALFEDRGLCCAPIGRVVDGGAVSLRCAGEEAVFWDLSQDPVTGFPSANGRPEPTAPAAP